MAVSALVLAYEHIVTQNKNNTDMMHLNVVKSIVGTTENSNNILLW